MNDSPIQRIISSHKSIGSYRATMTEQNGWIHATIGAVITVVFSFTGFSPLLGGGVAGYLHGGSHKRGARIGAIAGAIALLPAFLMLALIATAFMAFAATDVVFHGGIELLIIFGIMFPFMILWVVGLSAVGGYLGAYLKSEGHLSSGGNNPAEHAGDTESSAD